MYYFKSEFSRETMFVNRLLGLIKLRLCKDCQKLTSNKELRCYDCGIDHDEYLREKIACDVQDDLRAEYEQREEDDQDE